MGVGWAWDGRGMGVGISSAEKSIMVPLETGMLTYH